MKEKNWAMRLAIAIIVMVAVIYVLWHILGMKNNALMFIALVLAFHKGAFIGYTYLVEEILGDIKGSTDPMGGKIAAWLKIGEVQAGKLRKRNGIWMAVYIILSTMFGFQALVAVIGGVIIGLVGIWGFGPLFLVFWLAQELVAEEKNPIDHK